jgi:hypothetical protein
MIYSILDAAITISSPFKNIKLAYRALKIELYKFWVAIIAFFAECIDILTASRQGC